MWLCLRKKNPACLRLIRGSNDPQRTGLLLCKRGSQRRNHCRKVRAVDVPAVVQNNFQAKYPTASDVEWYDEEDGTFAAYFYVDDHSKTAKFSADGKWTETKTYLDDAELPAVVTKSINSKFKGIEISSVAMIEAPASLTQYEISAELSNITYLLTYDEKGTLLKKLEEVNDTDADMVEDDGASEDDE